MSAGSPNSGFEYHETIDAASAGLTVLDHLVRRYRHSSAADWLDRLRLGRVLLDGNPAEAVARLRRGQVLVWRRPPWVEPEAPLSWALVHRDRSLLGVVKPAGLPTLPGGGFLERSLLALVRRRFREAVPVHRLDRGASGVVLFARTAESRARLSEAFRSGRIDKDYRALVEGGPPQDELDIDEPIGRVPHPVHGALRATVPAGDPGARPARSVVRVLERRPGCSLVAVRPLTGRPHQIRIHLAAAGHPLVGEPVYAPGGQPRPDGGRPGDAGYLLHAERLRFRHPETGEIVAIESPPPAALRPTEPVRRSVDTRIPGRSIIPLL